MTKSILGAAILLSHFNLLLGFRVETRLGEIEGIVVKVLNDTKDVHQFRNIPYANKPERFSIATMVSRWTGILNATKYGPSCPQFIKAPYTTMLPNNETSEDSCLTLNIYVPYPFFTGNNRSVMVFIHGGHFIEGQGMSYDGSVLAAKEDVIVVTFNYRVGVFGFFTTGDANAPGNIGLWDQQLALRWVKENIDSFGGNSGNVTIFGQGAGAASVTAQALYPQNRGLFTRLIAQGGSILSPEYFIDKEYMMNISRTFADESGCDKGNTSHTAIVTCLKILDYSSLLDRSFVFSNPRIIVDGSFLTDSPLTLLRNKQSDSYSLFRSLDVMMGTNDADGSVVLDSQVNDGVQNKYGFDIHNGIPIAVLNDLARDISVEHYDGNEKITSAIANAYNTTDTDVKEQGRRILDLLTDFYFHIRSSDLLDLHRTGNTATKTFSYLFGKRNSLMSSMNAVYSWIGGAPHGQELVYLFGMEEIMTKYSMRDSQDVEFANQLMKMWAQFAKTGDPSIPGITWPEYDSQRKYQLINSTLQASQDMYKVRLDFWRTGISNIINPKPTGSAKDITISTFCYLFSLLFLVVKSLL